MNEHLTKKIICASAGTGKTYRLSLEYLSLLLTYYGQAEFNPDQILVITFTRKATAEIKTRIIQHLQLLSEQAEGWQVLAINLKKLKNNDSSVNPANPLSDAELHLIRSAYFQLTNRRDLLQVLTIDAFIHRIYRNLICPVKGLDRFEVDLRAIEKRIPYILQEIMSPELFERANKLLLRGVKPSLEKYQTFLVSLIKSRFTQYLIEKRTVKSPETKLMYYVQHPDFLQTKAEENFQLFLNIYMMLLNNYYDHIKKMEEFSNSSIDYSYYFKSKFKALFNSLPEDFDEFVKNFKHKLTDGYWINRLFNFIKKEGYFLRRNTVTIRNNSLFGEDWKVQHDKAFRYLADYLIYQFFIPEQIELLSIWKDVLNRYDNIIYKNKNFTFDDIAWFTFEGLYSSEPPLFDAEKEDVVNEFYEFLCHRIRFILIDEFQDTSILQFNILKPIINELLAGSGSKPYGGFAVVGDEKQSIFGWRGGERDLLLNLPNIFPQIGKIKHDYLTLSWRSSPTMMNFINGVFGNEILRLHIKESQLNWHYENVFGTKKELEPDTYINFKLQNYKRRSYPKQGDVIEDFIQTMVLPEFSMNQDISAVNSANRKTKRSFAILARTNEELENIRIILEKNHLTGEFQSNKSILDVPLIKGIYILLRFAVYRDWYDFLAFLRSDLILLHGKELKKVIQLIKVCEEEDLTPNFSDIPIAKEAYDLALSLDTNKVYQNILKVVQACRVQDKLTQQRDYLNLQKFIDLALEYESTYQSDLPALQGFMRYCEDNSSLDSFKQEELSAEETIQLLTVHKAKGLEFDTVFVWTDLSRGKNEAKDSIIEFLSYTDKTYNKLKDAGLTLHYQQYLEASSFNELFLEEKRNAQMEEMNILYVALTRAKSRLHWYVTYNNSLEWENYLQDRKKSEKINSTHYIVKSAIEYLSQNGNQNSKYSWTIGNSKFDSTTKEYDNIKIELPDTSNIRKVLSDWSTQRPILKKIENPIPRNCFKESYLVNKDNLKGEIAHFYFSKLVYAEQEERDRARIQTLRLFGNLLSRDELNTLIDKLEKQIPQLKSIFDQAYDLVFTEYPIFYHGSEYRIDRLMLNTKEKTCLIIDYKTGRLYEPEQIENYKKILRKLILPKDYKILPNPEYVNIEV